MATISSDLSRDELFELRASRDLLNALKISLDSQEQADHPFGHAPYTLQSTVIQLVDRFGPTDGPTRISFDKLVAYLRNKDDETLPGIVFLRDGSVAILVILRPSDSKYERWVVMTEKPRILAGSLGFKEIPAGMLDGNGDIAAAAAQELLKETEFGWDQFSSILLWEKVRDRQEFKAKKGKHTGLRDYGEKIVLRIINDNDFFAEKDGKTFGARALYEKYMKDKRSVHA